MSLVNIGLDLQILICTFLHPSDILTLRKTCKTLQLVTRQRTVWVDALRRVCLENMLFLPTYAILDMRDVELEQAAMAPRRWIELSTSFAARGVSESEVGLAPTTTRIIDNPFVHEQFTTCLIIVPGGRYMVGFSPTGLGVWDLGYISSADCKLIASVGPEGGSLTGDVHATPDGMGLVILSCLPHERCSFYEIYPQSESPQLTKIACLRLRPPYYPSSYVCPDKMVWFDIDIQRNQDIIFTVWDYRLNTSVSFTSLIDVEKIDGDAEVVVTQTSIIVLHEEAIFIWAIPPLLPQPRNVDYYSLPQILPAIRVKFPDSLSLYPSRVRTIWKTMSSWYFDPLQPLYFDKIYPWRSQLQRFKLIIEPDFSNATLHFINTIQITPHDFVEEAPFQSMFCEDTLVYSWSFPKQCGVYTGSILPRPTLHGDPSIIRTLLAVDKPCVLDFCPASGRLVHIDHRRGTHKIVVSDFLPYQRL